MIEFQSDENPTTTMEKRPTTTTRVKEAEGNHLQQQYKQLQREWDAIKQSNSKQQQQQLLRRSLTDSRTMVKALQLLDSSPRNLMSSLQHSTRRPPLEVKKNGGGLTVEEILRERRAAIQSGKLKGRRLFEPPPVEEGVNEVVGALGGGRREEISISSGWDGLDDDDEENTHEVRSLCSYDSDDENENINVETKEEIPCPEAAAYSSPTSSSSSFVCQECAERLLVEKKEKAVTVTGAAMAENEKKEVSNVGGYGTRSRMFLMVLLVIGLILFAIGMITIGIFGVNGDGNEVILVPT